MKSSTLIATLLALGLIENAHAVCPVCTVAVSTGVGLSRWLGVDDTITGLWLGGLIVSLIMWSINWMDERRVRFAGRNLLTIFVYYLLAVLPLHLAGVTGHPDNALFGIDKLVLGTVLGSGAFYAGAAWYERVKASNLGHAYFPFQKVVMPIAPLILLTFLFYVATK
jgi:hypothetical protein